jgi:hypothetical protein
VLPTVRPRYVNRGRERLWWHLGVVVAFPKGVLPKNVDSDPEWRATAIYTREEVVKLLTDRRTVACCTR